MNATLVPGSQPKLSLQQLVSRLLVHYQPDAVRKQSFILNDVPGNFLVDADENVLASVIGSLFTTVISRNQSTCIRISACTEQQFAIINVQDRSGSKIALKELDDAKPMAERLGGFITMNREMDNATTVSFRFLNN